jgi:hypothetical protein
MAITKRCLYRKQQSYPLHNRKAAQYAVPGRYNQSTFIFIIIAVQEQIQHLLYNPETNEYDVMIVKLTRRSSNPILRLNQQVDVPTSFGEALKKH